MCSNQIVVCQEEHANRFEYFRVSMVGVYSVYHSVPPTGKFFLAGVDQRSRGVSVSSVWVVALAVKALSLRCCSEKGSETSKSDWW